MLYKGNKPTESNSGSKVKAGAYKFKVLESTHYASNSSLGLKCKLWDDSNTEVTGKFWVFINLDSSAKDAIKAETDRRLTVLLGKPEIEKAEDVVNKTGWLVVRNGARNGEIVPFGGMYTQDKKSAVGNETMAERISEALSYDWTTDDYAVKRENDRKAKENPQATSGEDEAF